MNKNCNKMDGIYYDHYQWTLKDWFSFLARFLLKGTVICYLFYDSVYMCFLFIPFGVLDYRAMKQRRLEEQRQQLILQFRSLMEIIANGLSAGYSLEKAVTEAEGDLRLLYPRDAIILREVKMIRAGFEMNVPVEQLFQAFGNRSDVEDIVNFANVITVAKRSGGNLVHIIQKTVNSISEKLAVEEEISTMIAAKRYEQKIMMLMPYGIILYLRLTNEGFFDVLYHNLFGILLMTLFLAGVYVADLWAQKIMEIRV